MKVFILAGCFFALLAASACSSSTDTGRDVSLDIIIDLYIPTDEAAGESVEPDTADRDSTSMDSSPEATPADADDVAIQEVDGEIGSDLPPDASDTVEDIPIIPGGTWQRMAVTIDDEIVNGTNVMTPIDGLSFGYNPGGNEFITAFHYDYYDPSITSLWHLDEDTGIHTKKILTGDSFAEGTNFCMNEDWCQFIAYNESESAWIVMGPRSPKIMTVSGTWAGSLEDVSGDQPPNGAISYSHLFTGDAFLVYGYITGSGFSESLFRFDVSTGIWSRPVTGLPPVFNNCLALFKDAGILYSIGGVSTEDGGESGFPWGKMTGINTTTGTFSHVDLPEGLAEREGMACAADEANGRLYVFGGAVMNDNYDERNNVYHNDLWVHESGTWTLVLPDGDIGTFRQYGTNWALVGNSLLPNFGKNIGRMILDGSGDPRLILMGDVPGTATQIYTLSIAGIPLDP